MLLVKEKQLILKNILLFVQMFWEAVWDHLGLAVLIQKLEIRYEFRFLKILKGYFKSGRRYAEPMVYF